MHRTSQELGLGVEYPLTACNAGSPLGPANCYRHEMSDHILQVMPHVQTRFAHLICLFACSASLAIAAPAAFPGKQTSWQGFPRFDFEFAGRTVTVVTPAEPAPGNPWLWRGEFFGAFATVDEALLRQGWYVVYIACPNTFGSPDTMERWSKLYDELTGKYHFDPRPVLLGMSRGGLYVYNWAALHPDKVGMIYGDAPVCDVKSWPGGKGKGKGSPQDWELFQKVYGFNEQEALAWRGNPVDILAPIAKAQIPIIHVVGDADDVVPIDENTLLLKRRYEALGGHVELIVKPGIGHHPHSLQDPTPIVRYILDHRLTAGPPVRTNVGTKWKLIFSDEFDGTSLDTSRWTYRTGPRLWSDQKAENVSVSGGMLRIALKKEKSGGLDYTAGGIISRDEFSYGYYEARIKLPRGKGWHTSFWTMRAGDRTAPDRRYQEIDVCEQDSVDPTSYSANFHIYKPHTSFGYKRITRADLSEGFHIYGANFTARRVDFYLDGALVHTIDISGVPHSGQNIWLTSIAAGLHNTDRVDDAALPEAAIFDWVRYYQPQQTQSEPALPDLDLHSMLQPVPESAKLSDPDYYIWCGTMVRGDDRKYHIYYSRWPRALGHNAWVTDSEIAHAIGDSPFGAFKFVDVALPRRGKQFWDGLCTHNPTILRIGNKYYLYYMGNTGDGVPTRELNWTHRNNQRIGVAVADEPGGPWTRLDKPVLDVSADPSAADALMTSNPAVTVRPEGGVLMVYKAVARQKPLPFGGPVIHLTATADSPTGPFTKQMRPIFTAPGVNFAAEDPFIWYDYARRKYQAVVKDNEGYFTHAGKSLSLWESSDGLDWKLAPHPLVSRVEIQWKGGELQKLNSLERPQLMFGPDGKPQALLCAVDESKDRTSSYNVRIPLAEY
jgi:beta-glucanase (GH16 family)/pimeloyl-ACP methyl ester carboxylesterase